MIAAVAVLGAFTIQRISELILDRRHVPALLACGGRLAPEPVYPWIIALHVAWLGGLWLLAWNRPIALGGIVGLVALQMARIWVMATLGPRWTARLVVLPGEARTTAGPYRFGRHPNYLVVAAEVAAVPLAFGLWPYALAFSIANAPLLWLRARAEDRAWAAVSPLP